MVSVSAGWLLKSAFFTAPLLRGPGQQKRACIVVGWLDVKKTSEMKPSKGIS